MAFTPTSVMRKRANDKVDERHRMGEGQLSLQQLVSLQPDRQANSAQQHAALASMRPIVKGGNAPADILPRHVHLHQQQRQQQMLPQFRQQLMPHQAAHTGAMMNGAGPPVNSQMAG